MLKDKREAIRLNKKTCATVKYAHSNSLKTYNKVYEAVFVQVFTNPQPIWMFMLVRCTKCKRYNSYFILHFFKLKPHSFLPLILFLSLTYPPACSKNSFPPPALSQVQTSTLCEVYKLTSCIYSFWQWDTSSRIGLSHWFRFWKSDKRNVITHMFYGVLIRCVCVHNILI